MLIHLSALQRQFHSSQFEFAATDPRRLAPLSLEQQKKRAKELLRAARTGTPAAAARLGKVESEPRLSDAQRTIATELGFAKWTDLKAHIEQAQIARAAIRAGRPAALDARQRTLHIRCGSDIGHALAVAGFVGDLLVFADPYVQGPVPRTDTLDEFLQVRAKFLTQFLAPTPGMKQLNRVFQAEHARQFKQTEDAFDAYQRLQTDYAELNRALEYEEVNLWFEHDSYDQLILAKLLHFFSDSARRPHRLRLISVSRFPGVERFIGIGQLPPEAMRVLWDKFRDVTDAQLQLGRQTWDAILAPTPEALAAIAASGTAPLPTLAPALQRHLRELPSMENGLSLTESLTLTILADKGPMNAARLFGWYTNHYEPLPFLGDSGYWYAIFGLARAAQPALHIDERGPQPSDWHVALTPLGSKLLVGETDWLASNPIERWVGGVKIDARAPEQWRIDRAGNPLRRPTR